MAWPREGPLDRCHRVVFSIADLGESADIEQPPHRPLIFESRQGRMLAKDVGRPRIREGGAPAHPARHLAQHPPIGPRLAGRWPEGTLARDAALGVGDRAVLLAPAGRGQDDIGQLRRVIRPAIADDNERTGGESSAHALGPRHAVRRIGAEDPKRVHPAFERSVEQVDRLQPGLRRQPGRAPKAPHAVEIGRLGKAHMRGELRRQAANLAAAHRVWLAGQRKRPHAGPADPPGGEVAIEDRIDLVGTGGRLVHALRIEGERVLGRCEPVV